jgi:GTP-binding protein LepA
MDCGNIRNFCVIAHIDHGKSTLADRFLEITGTIEKRKMRDQVLDRMELERERGITIKMKPVRMIWRPKDVASVFSNSEQNGGVLAKKNEANSVDASSGHYDFYVLNLIDTPGHIDFSYEVSRALKAVEGAILLVDATQGIQAQTLSVLEMARQQNLVIIPAVNKIDSPLARIAEVKADLVKLLGVSTGNIFEVSGKTGQGVSELLAAVVKTVPPPVNIELKQVINAPHSSINKTPQSEIFSQGLIFDFQYSNHTGVILYVRVTAGEIRKKDVLRLLAGKVKFKPVEIGVFGSSETPVDKLINGEIGYLVTGIKEPGIALVGDTVTLDQRPAPALSGYHRPTPVVWASVYPASQNDFNALRQAIARLRLSDSSFVYEEESSGILGRGFRSGFLGMLHLEIIIERLKREFNLNLIVTTPSITYEVTNRTGKIITVYSSINFPDYGEISTVREPFINVKIITPAEYLGELTRLFYAHEVEVSATENLSDNRVEITATMPLRELMRGFFDNLKSATKGFGSLSYKISGLREAAVVKLELLVAGETIPAFTRIVARRLLEIEAEAAVEKLYKILPRQLFTTKIQAKALGRIIASRTLPALRKDVTGYLYGGDITRKKKLWEKQKAGKKRLKERGRAHIPEEVFVKMMKIDFS